MKKSQIKTGEIYKVYYNRKWRTVKCVKNKTNFNPVFETSAGARRSIAPENVTTTCGMVLDFGWLDF